MNGAVVPMMFPAPFGRLVGATGVEPVNTSLLPLPFTYSLLWSHFARVGSDTPRAIRPKRLNEATSQRMISLQWTDGIKRMLIEKFEQVPKGCRAAWVGIKC